MNCRICGNDRANTLHHAREMMFGTREAFDYLECGACGCLQLETPPADLSRFYPKDYYSYAPRPVEGPGLKARLQHRAMHHLLAYRMNGRDPLGRAISLVQDKFKWVPRNVITFGSRILDVGCGSGALLLTLQACGFTDLTGADPFIAEDIRYPGGVRILKKDVFALEGSYDLIMLHHAFEHMDRPLEVMRRLKALLAPGGHLLIRIPVADSHAWKHYGTDWVQLDAPRHFFLHTRKSMRHLAEHSGLELVSAVSDSTAFQFIGSERYRQGLSLNEEAAPFTKQQLRDFDRQARQLNAKGLGDTGTFLLRNPS
jgi:SAM-dependent methyltransferase